MATLSLIAVCSMCLAGSVGAYKAGYSLGNCQGSDITANGTIAADEWTDSFGDWLYDDWTKTTSLSLRTKYEFGGTPTIADQWLIDVASDTTSDANDLLTFTSAEQMTALQLLKAQMISK